MPRNSDSRTALPSPADEIGYVPGTRTDWSDPEPQTIQQALDNIGARGVFTTPTIDDFTNATHDHADAAGGGLVAHSALTDDEATKHRIINDLGTSATQLWSASKIDTELLTKVAGPASSTDNAIARYHFTTGKIVQDSLALLNDAGDITTPGAIVATGVAHTLGSGNSGVFIGGSGNEYIANDGAGTLTILAATALVLGNAGNTILGDGTLRQLRPHTDLMIDLGTASKRFNNIFCNLKTGITQVAAGAAAGELWSDTDDDNTVKLGV